MIFQYCTITRSRRLFDDDPAKAKDRVANIEPPASSVFVDAIAPTIFVKPAPLTGIWLPSPLVVAPDTLKPNLSKEKVIIHFPGGAFVMTFGHQTAGEPVSNLFTKHLKADKVLWAQYRLAADQTTCFPAAIQDAVTYYHYVVSLGVDPKNIIVSGDSAGGNVVIALIRYLESQKTMPLPGGAMVFSPWVHVTSNAGKDYNASSNSKSDILTGPLLQWGADSYLPKGLKTGSAVEAYISPLHHPFRTSVPLFIHVGAAEGFCNAIKDFSEKMEQLDGNRVRLCPTAKGPHDLLLCHTNFDMTGDMGTALDNAQDFFGET